MLQYKRCSGFSLVELLITVVLIGIVGIFAIWQVLDGNASLSGKYSMAANQAITMMAAAYQAYRQNNTATINTTQANIAAYLNYLSIDTSGTTLIDSKEGAGSNTCTSTSPCYKLHSGGVLQLNAAGGTSFCDTTPNSYLFFRYDPDGVYGNSTTGASKSAGFDLHFDGRIVDSSKRQAGDITCATPGVGQTGWGAEAPTTWFAGIN